MRSVVAKQLNFHAALAVLEVAITLRVGEPVALAPWRWTKRCIEIGSRPVGLALRPGEPPWVLQYSQLASCQSGSITFPFLSQA